jgi:thiol-disulfide isomerase/thioredoxin
MSRPPVFSTLSYADALAGSKEAGKLLVIDATASWCQPCKVMDRSTWVDPMVVTWLEQHAVAVQIDVDAEKELAKDLRIRSMPTVIAYRAGAEADRIVGLRKPADLLSWLDAVQRGETNLDLARAGAKAHPEDMRARYGLAKTLASAGHHEEATDEYVWLWQHVLEHEPAMVGVRGSYMLNDIKRLMNDYAPARQRFAGLRDALPVECSLATSTPDDVADWVALSVTLGEAERVLAWFDSNHALLKSRPDLNHRLRIRVVPLLTERGRWADVAGLLADPVAILQQSNAGLEHTRSRELPPELAGARPTMIAALEDNVRREAGLFVASLVAAGRNDEARSVLAEVRRLLPGEETERMLLEAASQADIKLPPG